MVHLLLFTGQLLMLASLFSSRAAESAGAGNLGNQSGKPFRIDMKKASKGLDSRIYRYGKGTALPTMDASDITIPQTAPAVNPNAAIPSGGVMPGGAGAAAAVITTRTQTANSI